MGLPITLVSNPHNISTQEWPFVFAVPSESRKNVPPYIVHLDAMRCTCPAGRNRKPCKHVRWVDEIFIGCAKVTYRRMMEGQAGWKLLHQLEHLATMQPEPDVPV